MASIVKIINIEMTKLEIVGLITSITALIVLAICGEWWAVLGWAVAIIYQITNK